MEKGLFKNLLSIIKIYKIRYIKALAMLVVSNGLLIVNPLIFRKALGFVEIHKEGPLGSIYFWVALLLILAGVSSYLKYRMRVAFISISRDEEANVRLKLFERIQEQSRAFYDRHGIGELISRLTNDIGAYRDVLGPGLMYPMFWMTLVVPGSIALFVISPILASIALTPLLLIPLSNTFFRERLYHVSGKLQQALASLSNYVQEAFSGIKIIKSYGIEKIVGDRFVKLCEELIKPNLYFNFLQGILLPFLNLLTKFATLGTVILYGILAFQGYSRLSTADFLSFFWIQSYVYFPVLMLAWVIPMYERGRAAYDRLVDIYEEPNEVTDSQAATLTIPESADISFNRLDFTYSGTSRPVFTDLNLKIKAGTFVGITGPVGAGKSTLFRLLMREYEIPRGMISIGEHDIHDYPLRAFSSSMVSVDQVPFLFSKSIAENVFFGREETSQEELEMVARFADLHETVLEFPERYDTLVGERGLKLSGGQKSRVAMARAFLVNRSFLLLDDIFSAVDAKTEARIFKAIKKHFAGKTVVLVTHRVNLLNELDRVIYMEEGKIVEDGSPKVLLKEKGYYAALADLQLFSGEEA